MKKARVEILKTLLQSCKLKMSIDSYHAYMNYFCIISWCTHSIERGYQQNARAINNRNYYGKIANQ